MSVYKGQEKVLNSITAVEEEKVKAIANERTVLKNTDLDTVLEEGKYYVWNTCTNSPVDFGHLNVSRYDNQFVLQTIAHYDTSNSKKIFVRTRQNGTWSKWQRLCTTSVADVPVTAITINSDASLTETQVAGYCNYYVSNGICYVQLYVSCTATMASWKTVCTLPKPVGSQSYIATHTDHTNTEYCSILYRLYDDGTLKALNGKENLNFIVNFSYKVKES